MIIEPAYPVDPVALMMSVDPMPLIKQLWPQYHLWNKQQEIVYSVRDDNETYVPAANKVGKDFVAGVVAVANFIIAKKLGLSCRIVTTSVRDRHLDVLWGEIGRFVRTAKVPLVVEQGGPLILLNREIRWSHRGVKDEFSYIQGMVSKEVEGLTGHHADWSVCIIDEASGVDHEVYDNVRTWAKRILVIGNCNPCSQVHFFRDAVKKGNIERSTTDLDSILRP